MNSNDNKVEVSDNTDLLDAGYLYNTIGSTVKNYVAIPPENMVRIPKKHIEV